MLEYTPWSHSTLNLALEKYSKGLFSVLDVELGGACNYHCVYCDSPDRNRKCMISINAIENLMKTELFDWLFICGLGEPTYNGNYDILINMLDLCRKYNIKCSIFSNISNLTPQLIDYVRSGTLNILFKYDSSDVRTVNTLYGIKSAKKQLEAIKTLSQYVHCEGGTTNLAASIVPTGMNYDGIMKIVEECIDMGIFPLLGELEASGKGEINYENLYLSSSELDSLKYDIERMLGGDYQIPICPSVISGIHISADSHITVDEFSGLSCHWFWLEEPKTKRLLPFDMDCSLDLISNSIINYRNERIQYVEDYLCQKYDVGNAFGGCGGKISAIFSHYKLAHEKHLKEKRK